MIRRNPRFRRHIAEDRTLLLIKPTHLRPGYLIRCWLPSLFHHPVRQGDHLIERESLIIILVLARGHVQRELILECRFVNDIRNPAHLPQREPAAHPVIERKQDRRETIRTDERRERYKLTVVITQVLATTACRTHKGQIQGGIDYLVARSIIPELVRGKIRKQKWFANRNYIDIDVFVK